MSTSCGAASCGTAAAFSNDDIVAAEEEETEPLLECGTSLAEREFVGLLGGSEDDDGGGKNNSSNGNEIIRRGGGGDDDDSNRKPKSIESLRSLVADDVLTDDPGRPTTFFASPFEDPSAVEASVAGGEGGGGGGKRNPALVPLVYCDQTASNRPSASVERYVRDVVLPLYGNTHTNASLTGSQCTAFVAEARQIVAEGTGARVAGKAGIDVVLFAGQGATSAVELLVDCLGLRHACRRRDDQEGDDSTQRPVVFVGPYEHHSNLVPWRECGCEVVMVPECPVAKTVDVAALDRALGSPQYKNRPLKMGTFTAASNVTGKVCDVDRIAATLHRHGALAFFDYATAAPYASIDVNPPPSELYPSPSLVAKDAVFLSPHKMFGGIGGPGVLVVKKRLVSQSNAPNRSGGGTVFYVTASHHRFLSNRVERYEGGTPNVIGIVRVGLAFLLKRKVEERYKRIRSGSGDSCADSDAPASLIEYEYATFERVSTYLQRHAPNLVLLGSGDGGRHLPIFSFLIRHGRRFLHFNYVCAVLNDVFGIQSRGGCQCSGPYSQRLLGLTETTIGGDEVPNDRNRDIEDALLRFKERAELVRPGYTRISLPFKGLRSEEVDYVMKALVWVSKHGWKLMPQYRCNHRTGEVWAS